MRARFRITPCTPRARSYPRDALAAAHIDVLPDGRAQFFLGEASPLVEAATLQRLLHDLQFTADDLEVCDVPVPPSLPDVG